MRDSNQSELLECWQEVRRDPWLLALLTWVPLLINFLLCAILSNPLPRDLPVALVDHDRSSLSRQLVRHIDASPGLRLVTEYTGVSEGRRDLSSGKIYALIVVPAGMNEKALLGRTPVISAFYNAQFLLIAKSIRSNLIGIEAELSVEVDVARTLPEVPVLQAALATDVPIRLQVTALYNSTLNYAQFLLPGMLAALLQVMASSVCILLLAKRQSSSGETSTAIWLAAPVGLCTIAFMLHGMAMLFAYFGILDWPRYGAAITLLPALLVFVLSSALLGAFFLAAARDTVRALSIAGAFSAPAFAFLGVTFPAADMSGFAQAWRDLMPASHFVDSYIAQIDYGVGQGNVLPMAIILVALLALRPWMALRLRVAVE